MNVDTNLIRVEREKRAWSQEHLASVTGLGVRTIQRIEASGSASYGSVMAIATALGMSVSDLSVVSEPPLKRLSEKGEFEGATPQESPFHHGLRVVRGPFQTVSKGGKQMRRLKQLLPSMVLAGGILVGTAVAVSTPSALWWIGPLLLAFSIVGARVLDNSIAARRKTAGVGSAVFIAIAFFVATALVAYADPAWVAMMIPVLGGGSVAVLSEPSGCSERRRGGLSRT